MADMTKQPSRSWLDHEYGKVMAAMFCDRLLEATKGRRGLFLTLTYRRDEFDNPQHLWRAQQAEQHVPLFMRRLARWLGEDLRGRWCCKAEFQKGGWVHFHLILLGVKFIPHDAVEDCWGHGYVWVKPLTPERIKYCAKYLAKDGPVPRFLLLERRVRIVRSSPGFFPPSGRERFTGEPRQRLEGCYVSVGQRLERNQERTQIRDELTGHHKLLPIPLHEAIAGCLAYGGRVIQGPRNRVRVTFTLTQVLDAISRYSRALSFPPCDDRGPPGDGREAAEPGAPFHLKEKQKRDAGPDLPCWLRMYLEEVEDPEFGFTHAA